MAIDRTCAACQRTVRFERDVSWAAACSCGRLVLRDAAAEVVPPVPRGLLQDLSPFRVGLFGTFEKEEFRITGRVQVWNDDGYRNYWSIYAPHLRWRWLVENFGNLALLTDHPAAIDKSRLKGMEPGRSFKLDEGPGLSVDQLKSGFKYAYEGELMSALLLPFAIEMEAGRKTPTAGQAPLQEDKVVVLVSADKAYQCLSGRMVAYNELGITTPTALDAWK